MNISADEQIREVLYTNERILWTGRSGPPARPNVLAWIPILFLVGWVGSILYFAGRNYLDGERSANLLFPISMASVGLSILAFIFVITPRHQRKIAYGVTNERALIVGGLFNRNMVSMPLEFMNMVAVRERRDASGTLVFEDFVHQCGEDRDDLCPYEFRDIEGVRRVNALIIEARGNLLRSRAERREAESGARLTVVGR